MLERRFSSGRRGASWAQAAFALCGLIFVVMVVAFLRLRTVDPGAFAHHLAQVPTSDGDTGATTSSGRTTSDTAALLVALVGVMAVLLVRPGEHPVTSRLLVELRIAVVSAALMTYAGAWLLALGPDGDALRAWWVLLTATSALSFLAVSLSRLLSRR